MPFLQTQHDDPAWTWAQSLVKRNPACVNPDSLKSDQASKFSLQSLP